MKLLARLVNAFLLIVFFGLSASAELITGQLITDGAYKPQIKLSDGRKAELVPVNQNAIRSIGRLKKNDRLVGEGYFLNEKNEAGLYVIRLYSIEVVGLASLRGYWGGTTSKSQRKAYYEFENDDESVFIYGDGFFGKKNGLSSGQRYVYQVFPGNDQSWNIVITNTSGDHIGRYRGHLSLHGKRQLKLSIVAPDSGLVVHWVKLRRIR